MGEPITSATSSSRVGESLPNAGRLAEGGSQPSPLTEGLRHGSSLSWWEVAGRSAWSSSAVELKLKSVAKV